MSIRAANEQVENKGDVITFAAKTFCPNRCDVGSLSVLIPTRLLARSGISPRDIIEVSIRRVTFRYAVDELGYPETKFSYPFSRVVRCPRCGREGTVVVNILTPDHIHIQHARRHQRPAFHFFHLAKLDASVDARIVAERMLRHQRNVIAGKDAPPSGSETYATSVYRNDPGPNMGVYISRAVCRHMSLGEGDLLEVAIRRIEQEYAWEHYRYHPKPKRNYYSFSRKVACPRCGEIGTVFVALYSGFRRSYAQLRHIDGRGHVFHLSELDLYPELRAIVERMLEYRLQHPVTQSERDAVHRLQLG